MHQESVPAGVSGNRAAHTNRAAKGLVLALVIALVDVLIPDITISLLYAIPIILVAATDRRAIIRVSILSLVLAVVGYFIKYVIWPPPTGHQFLNFRLINRGLVCCSLVALGAVLYRMCASWQAESQVSEEEYDPVNENLKAFDEDFSATTAALVAAPLIILISVIDLFTPANFNLPILYCVPLLIVGWAASRPAMWMVYLALLVLTIIGYAMGSGGTEPSLNQAFLINRFLAIAALTAVAVALHAWLGSDPRGVSRM